MANDLTRTRVLKNKHGMNNVSLYWYVCILFITAVGCH